MAKTIRITPAVGTFDFLEKNVNDYLSSQISINYIFNNIFNKAFLKINAGVLNPNTVDAEYVGDIILGGFSEDGNWYIGTDNLSHDAKLNIHGDILIKDIINEPLNISNKLYSLSNTLYWNNSVLPMMSLPGNDKNGLIPYTTSNSNLLQFSDNLTFINDKLIIRGITSGSSFNIYHDSSNGGIRGFRTSAVGAGSSIFEVSSGRWDGTNHVDARGAAIRWIASETWTDIANGTELFFQTVANGGKIGNVSMILKNTGQLLLGSNLTVNTLGKAKLYIQSTGTTSSSSALHIENSTGTQIMFVRDDGRVHIGEYNPELPIISTGANASRLNVSGGLSIIGKNGVYGSNLYMNNLVGTGLPTTSATLVTIGVAQYDATNGFQPGGNRFNWFAAENWTNSAQGTWMRYFSTPVGSNIANLAFEVTPNGQFNIAGGSATYPTLPENTRLYVRGFGSSGTNWIARFLNQNGTIEAFNIRNDATVYISSNNVPDSYIYYSNFNIVGNAGVSMSMDRYSTDTLGSHFNFRKSRGTIASNVATVTGDVLGGFRFWEMNSSLAFNRLGMIEVIKNGNSSNMLYYFIGSDLLERAYFRFNETSLTIGTSVQNITSAGRLHVRGTGTTNSTYSIWAENSSSTRTFSIDDAGNLYNLGTITSAAGIGAAGSNGQIQFNNSGILGASTNLSWNNTSRILNVTGILAINNLTTTANTIVGTTYLDSILAIGVTAASNLFPNDKPFVRFSVRNDVTYKYGFLQSYSVPGGGFNFLKIEGKPIIFHNGTSDVAYIDSSGNFGILSSPSWLGNTQTIAVHPSKFYVKSDGSTNSTWTAQFQNSTGTSNSLMIRDDGNIGIGTSTPNNLLEISSNSTSTILGSSSASIRITNINSALTVNTLSELLFANNNQNTNPSTQSVFAGIHGVATALDNLGTGGSLVFSTRLNSSGILTERMSILANGNVGIGTTNPDDSLKVEGASSWIGIGVRNTNSSGRSNIYTQNDLGKGGFIQSWGSTNSSTLAGMSAINAVSFMGGSNPSYVFFGMSGMAGPIHFGYGTATSPAMTITTNNNIGIGTNSPISKLDVRGDQYWGTTKKFWLLPDWAGYGELSGGTLFGSYGATGESFSFFPSINSGVAGAKVAMGYSSNSGLNVYSAVEIANVETGFGNLYLMKSGGNVGIGVSSNTVPLATLNIKGSGSTNSTFSLLVQNSLNATTLSINDAGDLNILGNITAGSITAAGANGQIQFNNSGLLAGNSGLLWDNTNSRLLIDQYYYWNSPVKNNDSLFIGSSDTGLLSSGIFNIFIGGWTARQLTTGVRNVAIGRAAMEQITTGGSNVALGDESGRFITTGINNTFLGKAAGFRNTTGSDNIYIGLNSGNTIAGNEMTGSYNVFLGGVYPAGAGTISNATALGYGASVNASNQMKLGNNNVRVVIGTNDSIARLVINGLGSTSSTDNIIVRNSNNTELLKIRDDGQVSFSNNFIWDPILGKNTITSSNGVGLTIIHNNPGGGIRGIRSVNGLPVEGTSSNQFEIGTGSWDGTSFGTDRRASIRFISTETWSSTGNGAAIIFSVTPNGSLVSGTPLTIFGDQKITIGNTGSITSLNISPLGRLHIRGIGNDSTTNALYVEQNNATVSFVVRDDGNSGFGTNTPLSKVHIFNNASSPISSPTYANIPLLRLTENNTPGAAEMALEANNGQPGILTSRSISGGVLNLNGLFRIRVSGTNSNNSHSQFYQLLGLAATENWTTTANGTRWLFSAVDTGTLNANPILAINGKGVTIGIDNFNNGINRLLVRGQTDTISTNTALFTNNTGTLNILTLRDDGKIAMGFSTFNETLNINGAIYLENTTIPTTTTNRLYSNSNNLYWNGSLISTAANQVFASNITVSLTNGKTLGRYVNGETIPAAGKTPQEVLQLIAQEPIPPTLTLTTPTTISFNQTSISNVLNFTYIINSLGATVSTLSLEWRRNNTGTWNVLTTNTGLTTFTHNFTDTNFNTQPFNYRLIVTDSIGGTNTITLNITPASYVAPSITFSAPAVSTLSPETNTLREKGNISSNLQGSTTRNSSLVNITSYQFAYSLNGGAWVNIGSSVSLATTGGSFTNTNNNDIALIGANTLAYRVTVTDQFTTTSATYNITFLNIIFFGNRNSSATNSSAVRSLSNRRFTNAGNTFNLDTGSTNTYFVLAIPNSMNLISVVDLDALNANITSSYILNSFDVNDAGGTATLYKIYTMNIAVPYSSNHRHQITIA